MIIDKIPTVLNPYKWVLVLVSVGILIAGFLYLKNDYDNSLRAEGRAEIQIKWDKDAAARTIAENLYKKELDTKLNAKELENQTIRNNYDKLKQTSTTIIATTNRERDSLRNKIVDLLAAATDPATTAARCGDYATRASNALNRCAEEITRTAANSDQLAIKLNTLQTYVKNICLKE